MIRVMFVCLGNICRSPMAEFVLKDMVAQLGVEDEFMIASSATSNEERGNPVDRRARRELERHGVPVGEKRAVKLTAEDYDRYDYLLGMEQSNIYHMERITGHGQGDKIRRLLSFTEVDGDIADPWYYGNFDRTYEDIVRGCRGFLHYLGYNTH